MRIELPIVQSAFEYICHMTGQLAQYTVKWIDVASPYIQNSPASYISLIGANIILFEVAVAISRLVSRLLNVYHDYDDLMDAAKKRRCVGLGLFFVSIIGTGNLIFCKNFRLPLFPWKVIAVSFTTCLVYLYCKTR